MNLIPKMAAVTVESSLILFLSFLIGIVVAFFLYELQLLFINVEYLFHEYPNNFEILILILIFKYFTNSILNL